MSIFETVYGHFTDDGAEYVITRPDTPRPWINVISNGDYGLVHSQVGGGYSWRTHANLNRLTRWSQDLLRDEWGKWIYMRDEDDGAYWSATVQPTGQTPDHYRCRHGFGYTTIEQAYRGLETSVTVFVTRQDPVEVWLLEVRNASNSPRTLSATTYMEWNLGAADPHREFHKLFIVPSYDEATRALFAGKLLWEVPTDRGHWNTDWPYTAFHGASETPSSIEGDKAAFMGRHRGPDRPAAMEAPALTGRLDRWADAVASLRVPLTLQPGETKTLVFTVGAADDIEGARALQARYASESAAREALAEVKLYWTELLGRTRVETPDRAFDVFTNQWVKYQAISGHMWARAAYYQQSGAIGFRDQLQTSQIWLGTEPRYMREQLVLHARHQLTAGTVLHWWHPLTEQGLETNMTDDLLWMPYMATSYLKETLDWGLLDEQVPFHDEGEASFAEHCKRAIATVLSRMSPRGLPLIGEGDWCDGFSAVGIAWKGESIWLGHFLHRILLDWAELLGERAPVRDLELARRYRQEAAKLKVALNKHAWNGDWFICATMDDGTPMGDQSCAENQIYLNSQTWAVMAESTEPDRARHAMAQALGRLEGDNGTVLFRPAYSTPDRRIGYITRYAPALRENGGVYTHAATWSVVASALLGQSDDAHRLHTKLNPIVASTRDPDRYTAEPYVLPGNIDGPDSPLYGRAGWTWYTGSAGWLYTAGLGYILGVRATYEGLCVRPQLPAEWQEVRVTRPFRNCTYDIHISRSPVGPRLVVDGEAVEGDVLPSFDDGNSHRVEVRI